MGSSDCYPEWKQAAAMQGYVSNIALPLFDDGRVFGSLSIYSTLSEPFDNDEVSLLEELAGDLAYGILNLRTRAAHDRHEALLRESLEQSIQAIAATVESRDPYTAGHQNRVAELATAIAREMGLDDERIRGIGFAGIIHDLGKIHIPAEILSKPGRLSNIEYQLIQTHPEAGYDIVKDVNFPWPIAQIILQHHERLNGSGYPQGLKGDAILLEAKIIAIADTVDAISSHRPYRSARGIETAMREIQEGKGSAFDPEAVEACVRLFMEKGFEFSTESPLITLN
ncbi:HD domain-containing phosphohydrolase [Sulfurimonas sp. HSL1-6]|uniref:HD-GYP domain-containing protein n=1 Tax=Thiomicrolovo immobilis TaxID=3131935 RepID=UPI0031F7C7CF